MTILKRTTVALAALMLTAATVAVAAPAGAQTGGSELADCDGKDAILVASDDQAESDVLSAITLAAATESCVVLAGARTERSIPDAEYALIGESDGVAYIVGGTAAVSAAKAREAGARDAMRFAGADRYETARLVGEYLNADKTDGDMDDADDMTAATADAMIAKTSAATGSLTLTEGTWTVTINNLTPLTCEAQVVDNGFGHAHIGRLAYHVVSYNDGSSSDTPVNLGHGEDSKHEGDVHGHEHNGAVTYDDVSVLPVAAEGETTAAGKITHLVLKAERQGTIRWTAKQAAMYLGAVADLNDVKKVTLVRNAPHRHGTGYHAHSHPDPNTEAGSVTYMHLPENSSWLVNGNIRPDLSCADAVRLAQSAVNNRSGPNFGELSKPSAKVANPGDEGGFGVDVPYVSETCYAPHPTVKHNPATADNKWMESWTFTVTVPEGCTQAVTIDRIADGEIVKSWSAAAKA